MASLNVGNLGEYLREQRRTAQLSLRQLADAAGVSNPYLSQIERGLRKPSAEVLQQVAKALRISAETLYVRAGILDAERDRDDVETRAVILADPTLNERQKQVLLQIYESFRKENGFEIAPSDAAPSPGDRPGDGQSDGPLGGTADAQDELRDIAVPADGEPAGDTAVREARRPRKPRKPRTTRKPSKTDGSDADPQQTAS
ncbi:transcriptional regulator with XRE-family HTH domain [Streptomyces sp. SAI-133]|uniref:helix-turn-helix domain-containing protein n=1 Tax=unclassified Streptomyces TaxID=2593676 RepID=UPI002475FF13|nr:helix-turn-helix transcriptional regulator [Streptomyces sp. SAI-133]MDH6585585.1 transcriptional regulator with XRE-family HTH domain [Streptomyces sp. SAI-133]